MAGTEAWSKLQQHYDAGMKTQKMRDLFSKDSDRFTSFSATFEDVLLDYSKNIVTEETMVATRDAALIHAPPLARAHRRRVKFTGCTRLGARTSDQRSPADLPRRLLTPAARPSCRPCSAS